MQAIPRMKLVWVTLSAGLTQGATVRFPDVPEIRGKKIIGIEGYTTALLSNTPDLQPCITNVDAVNVSVVLKDASDERVQDVPFSTLVPTNNAGIWKQVTPFAPNWQGSYVRLVDTPGTLPCTVPINVFYLD